MSPKRPLLDAAKALDRLGPFRYCQERNGVVHIQFLSHRHGGWEWPPGHMDAGFRRTVDCGEVTVTCFTCVMFMR